MSKEDKPQESSKQEPINTLIKYYYHDIKHNKQALLGSLSDPVDIATQFALLAVDYSYAIKVREKNKESERQIKEEEKEGFIYQVTGP